MAAYKEHKLVEGRQFHFVILCWQLCINHILPITITILNGFQKMVVERITQHLLQGKTLLQVEVSMPPHILIR